MAVEAREMTVREIRFALISVWVLAGLGLVVLVLIGLLHWQPSLLDIEWFRLKKLKMVGFRRVPKSFVVRTLRRRQVRYLFSLNTARLEEVLCAHRLIEDVHLVKVYPHRLTVTIRERKPFSVLKGRSGHSSYVVDEKGTVIGPCPDNTLYYPYITMARLRLPLNRRQQADLRAAIRTVKMLRRKIPGMPLSEVFLAARSDTVRIYTLHEGYIVLLPKRADTGHVQRLNMILRLNRHGKRDNWFDARYRDKVITKQVSI